MDEKRLFLKTAQAIRKLAAENEELKSNATLHKECLKLAFDMAATGRIDDSHEAISRTAEELMSNKEDFLLTKKAMKLDGNRYEAIGSIQEKTAAFAGSSDSEFGPAEMAFLSAMQENY